MFRHSVIHDLLSKAGDDRSPGVRMTHGQSESDGRAIVKDVNGIMAETKLLGESLDHLSQMIEAVSYDRVAPHYFVNINA
jgi:hypothetical protein